MTISYPLALPNTTSIKSVNLRARSNIAVTQSPFTYKQQVLKFQGSAWEADVQLKAMKRDEAEEWIAWMLSLEGQFGTFLLGDPNGATPRGSAATSPGTPLINGADQTGKYIVIDGCSASATAYLEVGDYVQFNSGASSKLHKILEVCPTDASGNALLTVYPEVKEAHPDNTTVTVSNCKGLFRLSSNEMDWSIQTNLFYGLTFSAVEAI